MARGLDLSMAIRGGGSRLGFEDADNRVVSGLGWYVCGIVDCVGVAFGKICPVSPRYC
jgi:hypothetical protein